MKNISIYVLKLIISIGSLFYAINLVGEPNLFKNLNNINFIYLLGALIIFWIAQVIASLRFFYIAQVLGGDITLWNSIKTHFIGLWFNQVLPTGLGGDVVKGGVLIPSLGLSITIRSILLDRFSGLFILMLFVTITLPLYKIIIPPSYSPLYDTIKIITSTFLLITVIGSWAAARYLMHINTLPIILKKPCELIADVWLFRSSDRFKKQFWTSATVHCSGIATYCLLALAIGLNINALTMFLIVPLVFIVALFPLSFAGWGVREIGAVWLFGMAGIPINDALSLSILYGLILIIAGLPGLLTFLSLRHTKN